MVRKTKKDAEKTREELLDAAETVFMQKGVAATTLNDIAKAAGVTRGAVYWHFQDKIALFNAMYDRVKLPMDEMFAKTLNDKDPLGSLKEVCLYCLSNLAEDKHVQRVFTIMLHKCEESEDTEAMWTRWRERRESSIERNSKLLMAAKKQGILADSVEPKAAALALQGYMVGICNDFLRNPDGYNLKKIAPIQLDIFFNGLQIHN